MAKVEDAIQNMAKNLEEKTGKSLEAWAALAKSSGKAKHGEIVAWLKTKHGLTHGYANLVAHTSMQSHAPAATGGGLIAAQYAGAKAPLKPIYDAIIAAVRDFGPDVEISPKKGYVSLRRSKQFAIVQPSTATRVDVGIKLKRLAPAGRLEAAGSWNAMVSHRVRLESAKDMDNVVTAWLKQAYDEA
jgi:predicted transport protein